MKFKYIATAILALSSLFACKQMVEDVPGSTPTVKIDRPTLNPCGGLRPYGYI